MVYNNIFALLAVLIVAQICHFQSVRVDLKRLDHCLCFNNLLFINVYNIIVALIAMLFLEITSQSLRVLVALKR